MKLKDTYEKHEIHDGWEAVYRAILCRIALTPA